MKRIRTFSVLVRIQHYQCPPTILVRKELPGTDIDNSGVFRYGGSTNWLIEGEIGSALR